jgi:hypothetical protein
VQFSAKEKSLQNVQKARFSAARTAIRWVGINYFPAFDGIENNV